MHFQSLVVDLVDWRVDEALVDDDVFTGATVTWSKLPGAEVEFVRNQLIDAINSWTGQEAGGRILKLRGTLAEGNLRYHAVLDNTELLAWETLCRTSQTRIIRLLEQVLATINSLLIIE